MRFSDQNPHPTPYPMHGVGTGRGSTLYILLILSSLIPMLLAGRYLLAYRQHVAQLDQWDNSLNIALEVKNGTFTPHDLLIMNSGHWHVPNHLAIATLTALTNWNTGIEVWLNWLVALINFGLLVYLFWLHAPNLTPFALLPFAMIVFMLSQERNWHFAYFGMWHYVNLFYLLALAMIFRRPPGWLPLLLAIFFTQWATLSLGTAATLWIVLPVTLWLYGYRKWGHFAAWGVMGVVMFTLYLSNNRAYMQANYPDFGGDFDPVLSLHFLLAYLGGVFVRYDYGLANTLAVGGILLFMANLFYRWQTQERDLRSIALWATLAAFAVASGAAISFRRIDSGLVRAFNDRYAASAMMLWISLFALMILNTAYFYQYSARRGAETVLINLNLLAALCLAVLYIQINVVTVQQDALNFKYNLQDRPAGYTGYEQCILKYPADRNITDPCLQPKVLYETLQLDERIFILADYRLNLFADQVQVNVLPETYQSGSPIILNTPNPWLNIYVREWMLRGIPESAFFHIAPPEVRQPSDIFPRPLQQWVTAVDENSLAAMGQFIGDADQLWYISTPERAADDPIMMDFLAQQGYVATPYPIQDQRYRLAQFAIWRFQKPPINTTTLFRFGEENISLEAWSLHPENPAPCADLRVQSWWRSEAVPQLNYSTTLLLLDATGNPIAQKDAAIGDTLMQLWQPGQFYFDERLLTLPCDLPPGDYRLVVGMYHFAEGTFNHLPTYDAAGDPIGEQALITMVKIEK